MSSEKYIGLDVHQATISVAVMDSQGKVIMESILETKASTILEFFAGLHGSLFMTFEEGTWAAWLYDLLKPHVTEVLVCNPRKIPLVKGGNKSDQIDARKLAERLRLHDLKPVYHGETGVRMLRELARSYLTVVKDLSRVMNRLKALYRSWASRPRRLLPTTSQSVLGKNTRGRNSPPRRATLSATGPAAALAPTSTARTAGGESPTCHHCQATANSVAGTDSFRLSGGADSDRASFSQQAPVVDLQRTGAGNPRQRRISLRQRPTAAAQTTGDDSRLEQGLQP
jgi:hypothetical protein